MTFQKKTILLILIFLSLTGTVFALPSYKEVRGSYSKSDSMILDRYGEPLYELRINKRLRRLDWTSLSDISPALLLSVIFAEDKRFFDHSGIDYLSIGAAIFRGIDAKSLRGASTITMQLASLLDKGLQPGKGRRSISQKVKQIKISREIERKWTKKQIMEAYLNLISFRGELQGINAASRGLYGKAPHGLNQSESLVLASLIRSPNAPAEDIHTRAIILRRVLNWQINDSEIGEAVQHALVPAFPKPTADLAPHAARLLLKETPAGNMIRCTIDARLQRFALERLKDQIGSLGIRRNVSNGAVLAMDNKTGQVLAYASCTNDPERNRFVDGIQAKRQAGSTLKPFLYALAFEKKILTPASILEDAPLDMAVPTGIYRPHNYEADYKGFVSARVALASSLNIPAVRALSLVGFEAFLAKLRRLDIKGLTESGDYYGPSMALGSIDVTLWELTNAYRCLANEGVVSEAGLAIRTKNSSRAKRVFSRDSVFLISDILSDREARSATFGLENPLATRYWSAVKTGTSKDMRDNWCVGYSHRYTVGVWIGNFSGEAMWDVSGISGAAPVWTEVMNRLHSGETKAKKRTPPLLVKKQITFPHAIDAARTEWFIKGTEPGETNQKIGQANRRIVYPPSGTVIALDPDIPADFQKVFFVSHPRDIRAQWLLNSQPLAGSGRSTPCWTPLPGIHTLKLCDEEGNAVDTVSFEVRGGAEGNTEAKD